MSESTAPPQGHVVHLLQHWGDEIPPAELWIRAPLGWSTRAILAVLLSAASALGLSMIVLLWTTPTPGWWFSLIFTVMIGGLAVGLWATFVDALRSGAQRQQASARWVESLGAVRSSAGVVIARKVGTGDDGSVLRFDMTVKTNRGLVVTGVWRPRFVVQSRTMPSLLQSQVPGVGSLARVWRYETATELGPLVIEVLDPTVTTDAACSGIDKYVD